MKKRARLAQDGHQANGRAERRPDGPTRDSGPQGRQKSPPKQRAGSGRRAKADHDPLSVEKLGRRAKADHDPLLPVTTMRLDAIRPSPENQALYGRISGDDPAIRELARSIRESGLQEPLLVTRDNWIVSGHRRWTAAHKIGLTEIPVRIYDFDGDDPRFIRLLRECNRQRTKSIAVQAREVAFDVAADTGDAWQRLKAGREAEYRQRAWPDELGAQAVDAGDGNQRKRITAAKAPMLRAIVGVLNAQKSFWPLSVRQVHYRLLNNPPFIHASKPDSTYRNDARSYTRLIDLLTRARVAGLVPMQAIADETRPVSLWQTHATAGDYLAGELRNFGFGYRRDLLQTQTAHIELWLEKLTVRSIIEPLAAEYSLPMTTGRGYSSLSAIYQAVRRFRASGKARLVVLAVTDHDPEGSDIPASLAHNLTGDFGLFAVEVVKVALTGAQAKRLALPPVATAKRTGSRYKAFVRHHGEHIFELESLPPEQLQLLVRQAIEEVLDMAAFRREVEAERQEADFLAEVRGRVIRAAGEIDQAAGSGSGESK